MIKVHFHTDCYFFGGCENMLANFFNSQKFRSCCDITFSYFYYKDYYEGFCKRVKLDIKAYPLNFIDFKFRVESKFFLPSLVIRIINEIARILLGFPLMIWEIFFLYRLFCELRPQILHLNNGGYPGARSVLAAAIAGKLAKIPFTIMVVNNMAVTYWHYSRWLDFLIDKAVSKSVCCFITSSRAATERLQKVLRLPKDKVFSIHNGVERRLLTSDVSSIRRRLGIDNYDGVVFGVVAQLVPRKGHIVLLNAVNQLIHAKGKSNFVILIEGLGPLKNQLEDFVRDNNLGQHIQFVGHEENIADFMYVLDVLILPSIKDEDFPNVILEAMACGKPVIGSNLAGIREQIIHGETGLLADPGDSVMLMEHIKKITDSKEERAKMGRKAKEHFNNAFTASIAVEKYINLYSRLLEQVK